MAPDGAKMAQDEAKMVQDGARMAQDVGRRVQKKEDSRTKRSLYTLTPDHPALLAPYYRHDWNSLPNIKNEIQEM